MSWSRMTVRERMHPTLIRFLDKDRSLKPLHKLSIAFKLQHLIFPNVTAILRNTSLGDIATHILVCKPSDVLLAQSLTMLATRVRRTAICVGLTTGARSCESACQRSFGGKEWSCNFCGCVFSLRHYEHQWFETHLLVRVRRSGWTSRI